MKIILIYILYKLEGVVSWTGMDMNRQNYRCVVSDSNEIPGSTNCEEFCD
jgi:hypothetical protein